MTFEELDKARTDQAKKDKERLAKEKALHDRILEQKRANILSFNDSFEDRILKGIIENIKLGYHSWRMPLDGSTYSAYFALGGTPKKFLDGAVWPNSLEPIESKIPQVFKILNERGYTTEIQTETLSRSPDDMSPYPESTFNIIIRWKD